jgi:hypothetical protein
MADFKQRLNPKVILKESAEERERLRQEAIAEARARQDKAAKKLSKFLKEPLLRAIRERAESGESVLYYDIESPEPWFQHLTNDRVSDTVEAFLEEHTEDVKFSDVKFNKDMWDKEGTRCWQICLTWY